jgi:N-acetylglucosamine kinase-like BadF-type ATPase
MILIADSGSTKTEWVVINNKHPEPSLFTNGISPIYLSGNEIISLLRNELSAVKKMPVRKVFFYGTGCNSTENNNRVKEAIGEFLNITDVFVGSDVLGAARSLCLDKPGIACIMGTGSNSCYYDGGKIVANISPLGYILGDEGSAAVLGKKLVSDILKNQLPQNVTELFFKTYKITSAEIIENVYRKPFPSRFLGQFAKFISENIRIKELEQIVINSFDDFIVRNILQYPESKLYPVHFTGSVAYHFKPQLEECLKRYGLLSGMITLSPMQNLIDYHLNFSYKQ